MVLVCRACAPWAEAVEPDETTTLLDMVRNLWRHLHRHPDRYFRCTRCKKPIWRTWRPDPYPVHRRRELRNWLRARRCGDWQRVPASWYASAVRARLGVRWLRWPAA